MKRRAVVMGATSGIGEQVAISLADRGWKVGVAGRRADRLDNLVSSVAGIVCSKVIDITDESATSNLYELIDELGGMDLYFHSSGIGWQNNLLDAEKEIKTVETNGVGFVRMVDAAFNWFVSNSNDDFDGLCRIACITSIAGTKGLGAAPAYSSTKRMQSHYLECLSQLARMRQLPIRISDLRPGFVATDLISGSNYPFQLSAPAVAKSIVNAVERGRSVVTINYVYSILVAFWRLIPRWLWVRMRITTKKQ